MNHKKYESLGEKLNPYKRLANGIVVQAAKDYKTYVRIGSRNPDNKDVFLKTQSLERFFRSQWFEALTNVSGEYIMERIKKEVQNELRKLQE